MKTTKSYMSYLCRWKGIRGGLLVNSNFDLIVDTVPISEKSKKQYGEGIEMPIYILYNL